MADYSAYMCALCEHPGSYHFSDTDDKGFYAFCLLENCDCWLDAADDEQD